jgi:hypothetical protein
MICGDCGIRPGTPLIFLYSAKNGIVYQCLCHRCYPHRCDVCRMTLGTHAGVVLDFPPHPRPRRRDAILATRARVEL